MAKKLIAENKKTESQGEFCQNGLKSTKIGQKDYPKAQFDKGNEDPENTPGEN